METRKITVVQTKNQKKSVIMSAATTLAELKNDLRANGIDYDGMTFFEGTSKIELKNDASVLPHDVPYKGTITNELVFMLTNTNKKIRSGADAMSRAEAYNTIKSIGLQDECVKKFGKNFTMCKTVDLIALIQNNSASKPTLETETKMEEKAEAPVNTSEVSAPASPVNNNKECINLVAKAAISKLVEILEDNDIIDSIEGDEVLNILESTIKIVSSEGCKLKPVSPYSDNEISDMFAEMDVD